MSNTNGQVVDLDKLAILVTHYLAGNVPDNLYWRVDVTAEALRRAVAVVKGAAATDQPSAGLENCGVCGSGQLYCNECGTGFASIRRASLTPTAPALPTNDEVYAEVKRERGSRPGYVSTNAVNDVMCAVRTLLASRGLTPTAPQAATTAIASDPEFIRSLGLGRAQAPSQSAPLEDASRDALVIYAESYECMARMKPGNTVDCTSVAYDIRRNMVDSVLAALARAPLPNKT